MHMLAHIKVRSSITYHVLLAEFEGFSIEFYALKLTMGLPKKVCPHIPFLGS